MFVFLSICKGVLENHCEYCQILSLTLVFCFFLVLDDHLQNHLVQNAIHMGFSLSEIKSIMQKKLQMSGASYTSVEDLVADLISAQKENLKEETPNENPLEQGELNCKTNVCILISGL